MDSFTGLNSREEASLLWAVIILTVILLNKNTRESLTELLKFFLNKKIVILFFFMILYIGMELIVFYKTRLLDTTLVKDIIFWFFGSALVLLLNINKTNEDGKYFKKTILDSLKFIIILEFIINFYAFNLFIEMMLVPLIFFLVAISTVTALEERFSLVKKIIDLVLAIVGIIIVVHVSIGLINNYSDLATLNNLRAFILPPALTILYVPFVYFVALFMAYELLFVRLKSLLHHEKSLIGPVKKKIILSYHINLGRLNKFSSVCANKLLDVKNKNDVNDFFASLK